MGVINQNISSSMNKSEANCCVLPVKKGKLWDDSSMIFLNCLELFENKYILLNFTELSANNYDQHPLLVNKCKVKSVSRAHCSSTVQFCLIQLAKLFGKNKEKKQLLSECSGLHKLLWGCVRRDIWCKNLPMWCYPL